MPTNTADIFAANPHGESLRIALYRKAVAEQYDDEFLAMLDAYAAHAADDPATYYWLAARFALRYGDARTALGFARKSLRCRPCNLATMRLLIDALAAAGDKTEVVRYKAIYAKEFPTEDAGANVRIDEVQAAAGRRELRRGLSSPSDTVLFHDCVDDARNVFADDYLQATLGDYCLCQPRTSPYGGGYGYWCGLRNDTSIFDKEVRRAQALNALKGTDVYLWDNVFFDIRRAKTATGIELRAPDTADVVLPLAGTKPAATAADTQRIRVSGERASLGKPKLVGRYEFTCLRVAAGEQATLQSEDPFVYAEPVVLRHSPQRKRLVLNLLLDGLSWSAMRADGFRHVPNLMRFFSQGVIFDSAYSTAEHTYPALASLAAGMYEHHTQAITGSLDTLPIPEDIATVSEQMRDLGYHCANTMGDGRGLANGATAGFAQLTVHPYLFTPAHLGVRFTLDHLHVFDECDNYVFLHVDNPHPYFLQNVHKGDRFWARTPWQDACDTAMTEGDRAFRILGTPVRAAENLYQVARMDADLAQLFDYITGRYREDEFIVNAFSDHGSPLYDNDPFFLKETQSSVALMCRGGGVPKLGIVDELASAVDLYAIMAREAGFTVPANNRDTNLPAAFGGKEREIVFSNSIFPNQTYKLAMRTRDYECRLEAASPTRFDCTVDLRGCDVHIYTRGAEHREIADDNLRDYFLRQAAEFTRSFRRVPLPKDIDDVLHVDYIG